MRRSVPIQKIPKQVQKLPNSALEKNLARSNYANKTLQKSTNTGNLVSILTSLPDQLRQNRSIFLPKSYAQLVKQKPTSSSKKLATEVKNSNRKENTGKKSPRQEAGQRKILFFQVQVYLKNLKRTSCLFPTRNDKQQ